MIRNATLILYNNNNTVFTHLNIRLSAFTHFHFIVRNLDDFFK